MLTEQRFRGGAYAEALGELFCTAVSDPRHLWRKALNVIFFALQQSFGDEHRHHNVFVPSFLEHAVEKVFNVFPNSRTVWTHDHAAAHTGIVSKIGLSYDIGIPLSKVNIHRGDVFHQFLFIIRHFRYSSLKAPYIQLLYVLKMQKASRPLQKTRLSEKDGF